MVGYGADATVQGTMGGRGVVRLCKHPTEEGFKAISRGHGVAGPGDIRLELGGGVSLTVLAEVLGAMGEFVTQNERPGVRRNGPRGDRVNVNNAIVATTSDPNKRAGIAAWLELPVNLMAGSAGDLAGNLA